MKKRQYYRNSIAFINTNQINDDSIFVYEDKNNPFMNVTGFKELMLPEFADDYMIAFGRNKMMTSTYDESNTSGTDIQKF